MAKGLGRKVSRLESQHRQIRVMEMRIAGKPVSEIARELCLTPEAVHNILLQAHKEYQEMSDSATSEYHNLMLMRYENLASYWIEEARTDPVAVGIVMACYREIRKLTGVDTMPVGAAAPAIVPVNINVVSTGASIHQTSPDRNIIIDGDVRNPRLGTTVEELPSPM